MFCKKEGVGEGGEGGGGGGGGGYKLNEEKLCHKSLNSLGSCETVIEGFEARNKDTRGGRGMADKVTESVSANDDIYTASFSLYMQQFKCKILNKISQLVKMYLSSRSCSSLQ